MFIDYVHVRPKRNGRMCAINQPIEAEGTVLRAGSYVLRLVDLPADRSAVCIFEGSRAPHYRDRIR